MVLACVILLSLHACVSSSSDNIRKLKERGDKDDKLRTNLTSLARASTNDRTSTLIKIRETMSAPSSPLGNALTGISSDAWYSIQAFASDYYLGLSNCTISHKEPPFAPSLTNSSPKTASPPTAAQLSDVEDPTLWQFIAAGPDTNRGVYALRSKTSQGRFCLVDGCEGPEICVEPPAVRECGNNAGQ